MRCPRPGAEPLARRSRWRGDEGLETIEYALVLALLITALVSILPQFSADFARTYNDIVSSLSAAVSN